MFLKVKTNIKKGLRKLSRSKKRVCKQGVNAESFAQKLNNVIIF
jgi:hypothetical protein